MPMTRVGLVSMHNVITVAQNMKHILNNSPLLIRSFGWQHAQHVHKYAIPSTAHNNDVNTKDKPNIQTIRATQCECRMDQRTTSPTTDIFSPCHTLY
jgi:hypothetical protein